MDRLDRKILQLLQQDGSISNQELADKIGLTAAPCSRRVRQLEESGIIAQHTVKLSARHLNLKQIVLLWVSMDKHITERFEVFEEAIQAIPEVIECYLIAGNNADYQLKIVVPDLERYHNILLGKITRIPGVSGVQSSFVLKKVFETTALPLNYLSESTD